MVLVYGLVKLSVVVCSVGKLSSLTVYRDMRDVFSRCLY